MLFFFAPLQATRDKADTGERNFEQRCRARPRLGED
jgi:hypothetical protein